MKKRRKVNIRIEIEPIYNTKQDTEENILADCKDIIQQIKRHVDGIGYITEAFETEEYCSFCNAKWDEDEQGVPYCCDKAENTWCEEKNMKYDKEKDVFVPKAITSELLGEESRE